jgi:3-hydroxyisobutyrate dehydrogenase
MTIGICGTGKMGSAMAARLIEVGEAVAVWNRTAGRAQPLVDQGAALAASPADLAATCEAVIVMLIDAAALQAVYEGDGGLLSADLGNTLIIEMSTVLPKSTQELAGKVRAAGGAFVECPVGGTVMPARQGQLIGLIGGAADDVARARPVLEHLCRRTDHVGPVGAGAAMKLAINLPVIVYWEGLGEALSFAEQAGVDRALAAELLGESSGAARVAPLFLPQILEALDADPPPAAAFEVTGALKDLDLMLEFAADAGIDVPSVASVRPSYQAAVEDGWGDRDFPLLTAWRFRQHKKG